MNAIDVNTDKLVRSLKRVATESEALLKATAGAMGDRAQAVRDRFSEALDQAKENCQELEKKAIRGARATDKIIRAHPYQSLGVAFGLGLLLGVLAARE